MRRYRYCAVFRCRPPCHRNKVRKIQSHYPITQRPACLVCGRITERVHKRQRGPKRFNPLRRRILRLLKSSTVPISTVDIGWILFPDVSNPRKYTYSTLVRMQASGQVRKVSANKQTGAYWTSL